MQESRSAVIDANGGATVRFDAASNYYRRRYNRVAVTLSTGENSQGGTATVYAGETRPGNRVDATSTPWNDAIFAIGDQLTLVSPLQLTVVFAGCDVGATAIVTADYTDERG